MIEHSLETATATAHEAPASPRTLPLVFGIGRFLYTSTSGPFLPAEAAGAPYDAAALVNEPVGAKHRLQLRRVLVLWAHYEVIAIDELGFVPNHK